jgi:hypothetical protein
MWMYYSVAPASQPASGRLAAIELTGSSTGPISITQQAVIGFISFSLDWTHALTADHLRAITGGAGSTLAADLVGLDVRGARVSILRGIDVGHWDSTRHAYVGPCVPSGVFTSSAIAFAAVCPSGSQSRSLFRVVVTTGASRQIASDAVAVVSGIDHSYVLFLSSTSQLFGVDRAGATVTPLDDTSPVSSLVPLVGKRFAYTTSDTGSMKVAVWPRMEPATLLSANVDRLEKRSPNGSMVMARSMPPVGAFRDLFVVPTSTQTPASPVTLAAGPTAAPADSPFSNDSAYAFWYDAAVLAGTVTLGDARSMAVGGGSPKLLSPLTSSIFTYTSTVNLFLMQNAREMTDSQGQMRLIGDLSVRRFDASRAAVVLVPQVDARAFRIRQREVLFRIVTGAAAGLWIGELPLE